MTHRSSVVLPAPFRPTSVTSSPSPTCSDTSRSAWASPYLAERSAISSAGLGMRLPEIRGNDRGILAYDGVAALGDHPALLQHDDLVGELGDHTHVVLDEHYGPARVRLSNQVDRAPDVLDAHARGRLVQQKQARVERDCEGELQRALLPVRKLAGGPAREVSQTDLREELARSVAIALERALGGPKPVADRRRSLERELGMLERGELVEEARDLEGARDPAPRDAFGRQPRGIGAEDDHASCGRPKEAGQEIEEGRLPRTVGTDERVHFSWFEPQVHAVHGTKAGDSLTRPTGSSGYLGGATLQLPVFAPAHYGRRWSRSSFFP